MRIAVISDIHGNALALDAVLADLERDTVDRLVCLGDAIQGGPQPAEVVARLRDLRCPVVMGNADWYLLTGQESGAERIPAERLRKLDAIRLWALDLLSQADQDFIRAFQPTIELPLDATRTLLCFHGSPRSYDDIILPTLPDDDFEQFLADYAPAILTGGHTHMQQVRRLGATDAFFFNPGAVGLVYSHRQSPDHFRADAWAEYAVISNNHGRISVDFRRVPYSAAELIEIYRASGRPFTDEAIAQYSPRATSSS